MAVKARASSSPQSQKETEQMLEAIRQGGVDAFVVQDSEGDRVYTLEGSDLPYSDLVERMQQGAAMLTSDGAFIYCNRALAALLGAGRETLIGRRLHEFLPEIDSASCATLIRDSQISPCDHEMTLLCSESVQIPGNFSFTPLTRDKSVISVLVTDLRQQKAQAEFALRLQTIQEEERKRVSRELHDSAGQILAAIGISLALVSAQADKLDASGAKALSDSTILLDQVSSEIRTMSHLLHPPLLDAVGLVSALRWYVDGFSERSKIKVELQIDQGIGRLHEDLEIAIFRIVQECLTNVHRHSGSASAAISLRHDGQHLKVAVRDEGRGISAEKQRDLNTVGRGGVGFIGMRERLRRFGGTLEVQSSKSGTTVTAMLKAA
ncbi:MAG TPA: ATP-binding protein [Candidatus Sulfotelmatobacter sp.]|jgi:PAS domain S-box-containing protein